MKGTIKSKDEIAGVFETGQRIHTDSIMALVQRNDRKCGLRGRVAFIAGKKLGSAPVRSKAKRKMREASYCLKAPWLGYDVVFIAKKEVVGMGFENVLKDMETIHRALFKTGEQTDG